MSGDYVPGEPNVLFTMNVADVDPYLAIALRK